MRLRNVLLIYRKEVTEFLRDRRTILSLIVAPLVVMPVFMLGTSHFVSRSQSAAKQKRFVIGVREQARLDSLPEALRKAGFEVKETLDPRAEVEGKKIDIGIDVQALGDKPLVTVYSDATTFDVEGQVASSRMKQVLNDVRDQQVRAGLRAAGIDEAVLRPFTINNVNLTPARKQAGSYLGMTLGFILVIFMLSGGMHPAIDMTAGEKERRTMEMLLSSSASREEIVLGKLFATLSATLAVSMLSVASFALSFFASRRMADPSNPMAKMTDLPLDVGVISLLALASIPMAILAAAVTLSLTVQARSYKEATSYITPLLFVGMFLGMSTVLPGARIDPNVLPFIPIANFCKVVKDLLVGEWSWNLFGSVLAINCLYAAVAVAFAIRKFRDESVLFRV